MGGNLSSKKYCLYQVRKIDQKVQLAGESAVALALTKRFMDGKQIKKCADTCDCKGISRPKNKDPGWTRFEEVKYRVKSDIVLGVGRTTTFTFHFKIKQSVNQVVGYCQQDEEELRFFLFRATSMENWLPPSSNEKRS